MSSKRRADDDLNHENWDTDLKKELAGEFRKASKDIIQQRVIRTAKRRGSGSPASFTDSQEPAKNLFSSFGGFKTNSSNSEKDLKSTFSFLNSNPLTTNGNQPDLKKDMNAATTLSLVSNSSIENKSVSSPNTINGKKYPPRLVSLNKNFSEWIKSHVDKDPSCILTPVFRDYERYLKELEDEFTDATDSGEKMTNSSLSPSTDSTTSKAAAAPLSFFKSDSNSTSTSTFLSKPDQASLMVNPFTNKQSKGEESAGSGAKGFSFNANSQPSSTPSGFSFGGTKPFTFGNVSATPVNSNAGDGEAEAEETDEPPKPDFKPVQEDDAVYSKRCKVFIKKESGYADLGVGTLYVKPVAGDKHQLIVRADTSLGNVLINVLLSAGIPLQRMAKNNVMMICVPTPGAAASTVLLRVKTADEADQLLANLEKYRN
ncbi:nuclear pore complex protein Nup50 [Nilaparvata lugens]|uniref:nuclear pore complex protein Nup50 n=1 Tax=Nilaparvata lugens TaxID=108931 RepID=UPI00193DF934|nr:nuclear pore complex protein Nup50 [Nilaparvata lugens]